MSQHNSETENNIPDGGYGWVVLAGVTLINISTQSIPSCFGLLFGEHLQQLNQKIYGAALLTSLQSIALNFSGFLVGPAIKIFRPRNVAFTGCLLITSGLLLCALSTKLWHLILGYSIFFGVGLGLIAPSTFIMINLYFLKKRGCAVGIALAGTGFGQIMLPQIVRYLLENYGYFSTVLAVSGLALNGLVGACLLRPIDTKEKKSQNDTKKITLLLDVDNEDDKYKNTHNYEICKTNSVDNKQKCVIKSNDNNLRKILKEILEKCIQAMDLELLKDPIFCNIIIGIGLVYTVSTNFSMLFPYFLQFSVGLSRSDTATCMSVLAGTDTLCRLLLPIFTSKMSYRLIFLLGSIGLVCSRAILAESNNYHIVLLISAFYGCAKSATILNNNLIISAYCTPDKLPGGLGLNMISKGIIVVIIGQFLGWLRDYTKSYVRCLHMQNFLVSIVIISWIFEFLYKSFLMKNKIYS